MLVSRCWWFVYKPPLVTALLLLLLVRFRVCRPQCADHDVPRTVFHVQHEVCRAPLTVRLSYMAGSLCIYSEVLYGPDAGGFFTNHPWLLLCCRCCSCRAVSAVSSSPTTAGGRHRLVLVPLYHVPCAWTMVYRAPCTNYHVHRAACTLYRICQEAGTSSRAKQALVKRAGPNVPH